MLRGVDRLTWAIVGGVLGLVLVAMGAAAMTRVRDVPPDLSTPGGVTLAYARAIQRGDGEQAWDLLSSTVQARTTRERFLLRASSFSGQDDRSRVSVEEEQVEGETARVELGRTYRPGGLFSFGDGYTARFTVRLARERGNWRITVPPDPYLVLEREDGRP